jgi:hypothetical protein
VEFEKYSIHDQKFLTWSPSPVLQFALCEKYWNGDKSKNPDLEVLGSGKLKIIERIEL